MSAREIAFKILLDFEKSKDRLDDLISVKLKDQSLSNKERKFVYNLCSGVMRNKNLFDWKLSTLFRGNYKKTLNKFKTNKEFHFLPPIVYNHLFLFECYNSVIFLIIILFSF